MCTPNEQITAHRSKIQAKKQQLVATVQSLNVKSSQLDLSNLMEQLKHFEVNAAKILFRGSPGPNKEEQSPVNGPLLHTPVYALASAKRCNELLMQHQKIAPELLCLMDEKSVRRDRRVEMGTYGALQVVAQDLIEARRQHASKTERVEQLVQTDLRLCDELKLATARHGCIEFF